MSDFCRFIDDYIFFLQEGQWHSEGDFECSRQHSLAQKFRQLILSQGQAAWGRSCLPAHLTASAVVVNHDGSKVLLTLHKKLQKWLQLGGHCEAGETPRQAALREAREESGLAAFDFVCEHPIDLDIHDIPPRGTEPGHQHYDIRYVLRCRGDCSKIVVSSESQALQWFDFATVWEVSEEPSLRRVLLKSQSLLEGRVIKQATFSSGLNTTPQA